MKRGDPGPGVIERDFPVDVLPDRGGQARAWLDSAERGEAPPTGPVRLAATVMLLREGPGGVEVFMMRRAATMVFAAQMMVFPGGAVDPADTDTCAALPDEVVAVWAARHGVDNTLARAVLVAAVREVFEEVGVLLARPAAGSGATDAPAVWTGAPTTRSELAAGARSLPEVFDRAGLRVAPDDLVVRAHWVTPLFERRRFDTWILAAALPPGQQVADVSGEADQSDWVRPQDVLDAMAAGTAYLLPPTMVCLEELASAGSVEAFLHGTGSVPCIMPVLVRGAASEVILRTATCPEPV
ncbi:MAG: NUDIX hydrolase [Dermatophilaceae bacterium]